MKHVFLIIPLVILTACVVSDRGGGFVDGNTLLEVMLGVTSEPNAATGVLAEPTIQSVQSATKVELGDFGPAPELTNQVWLNVTNPLRLQELRGKVVLLEMWTFG